MAKLLQERAAVEKRLAQLDEFQLSDDDEQTNFPKSDIIRQMSYLPLTKLEKKNQKGTKVETEKANDTQKTFDNKQVSKNVIIIGHIPHGFYEPQIFEFLKQFGYVKGLQLSRSKKTGRSRGYAFVRFASSDVAQIVVQSVNGYMVGDKILTCKIVSNPETFRRLKLTNTLLDEEAVAKRHLLKISRTSKLFSKMKAKELDKYANSIQTRIKHKQNEMKKIFGVDYEIPVTNITVEVAPQRDPSPRNLHRIENQKMIRRKKFEQKRIGVQQKKITNSKSEKSNVQKNNNKQKRTPK